MRVPEEVSSARRRGPCIPRRAAAPPTIPGQDAGLDEGLSMESLNPGGIIQEPLLVGPGGAGLRGACPEGPTDLTPDRRKHPPSRVPRMDGQAAHARVLGPSLRGDSRLASISSTGGSNVRC